MKAIAIVNSCLSAALVLLAANQSTLGAVFTISPKADNADGECDLFVILALAAAVGLYRLLGLALGRDVIERLRAYAADKGKGVLVASRDLRLVPFANRIYRIDDGRLTSEEPKREYPAGLKSAAAN